MKINDANLTFNGTLSRRSATRRIVLHHAEASTCTPQDIHRWHLNNGWSGAGYHFLVRKDGTIWSLRPEWAIGAHASGGNSDSIGVCFEGRYEIEDMPTAQLESGKELVAHLKNKYGISKVQKHSEITPTSCPGSRFPFTELAGSTTTTPSKPVAPTPSKPTTGGLAIDGKWGNDTTRKLQQALGTPIDGIISNQSRADFDRCNKGGLLTSTFKFGTGGSPCIKALQIKIGVKADGYIGVKTIQALQRYLGTTIDGYVSAVSPMVKALQQRLNNGTF